MRITHKDKKLIDQIPVHDALFTGFAYDYTNRDIQLVCERPWESTCASFSFRNVIFCSMQSCEFWGKGENILWLSCVENPEELQKLLATQSENKNLYELSCLDQGIDYISLEFRMNAGASFLVICESVEVFEKAGL